MSNKRRNYQQNQLIKDPPKDLTEHPFYGLKLDPEQQIFRDAIWDPEKTVVVCEAAAGVGKTLIALATANLLVEYGLKDGILYIMSPTQEQTQGYLPGTIEEKSAPYMQPLIDAMNTLEISPYCLQTEDNIQGLKSGEAYIQFCTDTFLRGCNLENKVIIVDEMSNYYLNTLKKVLTRIHDNCKVILIGSLVQSDILHHKEREGFSPYLIAFKNEVANNGPHANKIAICELHTNHRGWFSKFCDDVHDPFDYR